MNETGKYKYGTEVVALYYRFLAVIGNIKSLAPVSNSLLSKNAIDKNLPYLRKNMNKNEQFFREFSSLYQKYADILRPTAKKQFEDAIDYLMDAIEQERGKLKQINILFQVKPREREKKLKKSRLSLVKQSYSQPKSEREHYDQRQSHSYISKSMLDSLETAQSSLKQILQKAKGIEISDQKILSQITLLHKEFTEVLEIDLPLYSSIQYQKLKQSWQPLQGQKYRQKKFEYFQEEILLSHLI